MAIAAIAAGFMLVGCIAPVAHATFPGQNGKIAFTSDRDDSHLNLFTADADGSGAIKIVDHGHDVRHPSWSWDGANLAFGSVSSDHDIYTAFSDGSAQTNLTTYRFGNLQNPTWAPAGGRVAFDSWNDFRIYILEVGTTNEQTLVPGEDPAWSPDGSRIAFQRSTESGAEIWTVDLDDNAVTNLSNAPGPDQRPDWSPDGSKIAYDARPPGGLPEIYVMDADGANQTRLTHSSPAAVSQSPSWSPDGSRIAFASNRDGDYEIYTMLADGSDVQQVTDDPARDEHPAWQPLPPSVTGFYPRPAGATPFRASLVTAFRGCASPNRTHGPPLEHPSCNPPVREASGVTVGSPDANGYAANSVGSVRIATVWHPGPPEDSDVRIDVSVTDVHCTFASSLCAGGGTLPDYVGELRATAALRATDRDNRTPYPGPAWPATGTIARVFANVPCAPTPSSAVGSTCSTATTLNSVVPGLVKEGLRSIWELGPIEVHSGGDDGDVNTTADNTPFLAQGLFVP